MPSSALPRPLAFALSSCVASLTLLPWPALAAPPAPSGAHPRIWLTPATVTALKAKLGDSKSWASKVVANCTDVAAKPGKYASGQYFGYVWADAAASCGAAWQLTKNPTFATAGLAMWTALLNDSDTVGDGKGGDDVVHGNDGYGMRNFAAYAAVAYDWLHDAPGAAALVTLSQERFKAWVDYYDTSGYLKTTPGSNYHAGYVLAKALIAVAASGEDDGSAAKYFAAAVDQQYGQDIVAKGLGDGGALVGGDWPEGWEYGPLGVIEYSLGARALEEQGASFPEIDAWAGTLVLKYLYSLTPDRKGMYIGGDWGSAGIYATPLTPAPLVATLAGGGSAASATWAESLKTTIATTPDLNPINDALAEARGASAVDFTTTTPPLFYVAAGTRTAFARSAWDTAAFWSVFTSAPQLGPDHQHIDASNLVFSRGGDALIVDPSPYGSLSSLTGNAMTVDSQTVSGSYRPSQSPYRLASLPWARGSQDGTAGARADLDLAFIADAKSKTTDVPFARRDWTFLPEGEIVTIDRVRASSSSQKTYLRFRSAAASLTLSAGAPWTATGSIGGSQVVIHAAVLPAGTPSVTTFPANKNGCNTAGGHGACTDARFAVSEYSVVVPASPALAIHVIDGLATSEAPATVVSITDPSIDASPSQNAGVVGVSVTRNATRSYVVASSAVDGKAGATLTYGVPGDGAARHVVYDAPEDASGVSTVAASASNGRCVLTITAGGSSGFAGRPLVFNLDDAANGCKATESKSPPPPDPGTGTGASSGGGSGGGAGDSGITSDIAGGGGSGGGCGCSTVGGAVSTSGLGAIAGLALLLARRRRRRG